MLDSQVLHTLRLLESEEIETLHLFVASPIFQDRYHAEDTRRLFEDLKRFYPAFQGDQLHKENVAKRLFDGRTDPEFDVTRAMGDLMRITRHFINFRYSAVRSDRAQQHKNGTTDPSSAEQLLNDSRQQLALMRFYNERLHNRPTVSEDTPKKEKATPGKRPRRANKFFENIYKLLQKDLEEIKDFSTFEEHEFNEYLYFRYLVQQEKSLFDGRINPGNGDQNLMAAMEELDAFYLFGKLHLLSKLINLEKHKDFSEEEPEVYEKIIRKKNFMLLVCRLIRKADDMKVFINFYLTLLNIRGEKNSGKADILARDFVEQLDKHQKAIPETLFEEFEIQIRNYWTSRFQRTREEEYLLLLHNMQVRQVERLRLNKKGIPASQLTNILFTAFKINKIEWADEVLGLLGPRIMDADAALIHQILIARLRFDQKHYAEAREILPHSINYGALKDMVFYKIAAGIDIKICYEMNCLLDDLPYNMFRATQTKIKRDKSLTPERREQRIRFFPVALTLYRAKDYLRQSPKANVAKSLKEVWEILNDKSKPIVDDDWLLLKWMELAERQQAFLSAFTPTPPFPDFKTESK